MLLPIETFYDESNNKVFTHVDELGTYCLIDLEKWFTALDNAEGGYYNDDIEATNAPANIVFCLDTRNIIDSESFESIKSDIKAITEDSLNKYSDIKVYIYYQNVKSTYAVENKLVNDSKGNNYFTSYEEAEKALNKLERYMVECDFVIYDYVSATQYMIDICDENIIAMYHITGNKNVMGNANKMPKLTEKIKSEPRIHVSILCPFGDVEVQKYAYAVYIAEISGGVVFCGYNAVETQTVTREVDVVEVMANLNGMPSTLEQYVKDNIFEILGEGENQKSYQIISSTGLTTIRLKTPLKKALYTDTDYDGLSDWEEVNTTLIFAKCSSDKNTIRFDDLPNLGEFQQYNSNLNEKKI